MVGEDSNEIKSQVLYIKMVMGLKKEERIPNVFKIITGCCSYGDELSSSSSGIAYDTQKPYAIIEEFRVFFVSIVCTIDGFSYISF